MDHKPIFSAFHLEGVLACAAGASAEWSDPACRGGLFLGTVPHGPAQSAVQALLETMNRPIRPIAGADHPPFKHIVAGCFQGGNRECLETIRTEPAICLATATFDARPGSFYAVPEANGERERFQAKPHLNDPVFIGRYCAERELLQEADMLLKHQLDIAMALARHNHANLARALAQNKALDAVQLAPPAAENYIGLVPFNWLGNSYDQFAPAFLTLLEQKQIARAAGQGRKHKTSSI